MKERSTITENVAWLKTASWLILTKLWIHTGSRHGALDVLNEAYSTGDTSKIKEILGEDIWQKVVKTTKEYATE